MTDDGLSIAHAPTFQQGSHHAHSGVKEVHCRNAVRMRVLSFHGSEEGMLGEPDDIHDNEKAPDNLKTAHFLLTKQNKLPTEPDERSLCLGRGIS